MLRVLMPEVRPSGPVNIFRLDPTGSGTIYSVPIRSEFEQESNREWESDDNPQ
jgi:hypothetical protein